MKKNSFCVLLPVASNRVACFNDLQNKRAFFFSVLMHTFFPIGESRTCWNTTVCFL